jgi:flagellar motor switch protein FliN
MDESMTTATAQPALQGLVENCRKAWGDALSRILGSTCEVQVLQEQGALPNPAPICVVLNAEGAISGQAAFLMDQRNAGMLAAKCGASTTPQALQEMVRQSIVLAINLFQKQYGPTRAQFAAGTTVNFKPETVLALVAGSKGADALRAYLLLSPEISGAAAPAPTLPPVAAPEAAPRTPPDRNLSLMMGVQLEVTLRFGQKRLLLKQLVELNAGAVVELDKRVHEPVDLLLRDKVFARGEVVIVDGNYGLRITELCASQETL